MYCILLQVLALLQYNVMVKPINKEELVAGTDVSTDSGTKLHPGSVSDCSCVQGEGIRLQGDPIQTAPLGATKCNKHHNQ